MMVGRQFVEYKPPVIGEEQRGERKGNDEANHTQKAAPDGEAEKDDGWIEPCDMPHDARREVHVLDELHHGKHHQRTEQDEPEVASRIGGLEQGQ